MMGLENVKDRTTKVGETSSDIRDFESKPRILGDVATISDQHGDDQIGTSGKDSNQADTLVSREQSGNGITGKIIDQLINETERQLAYHETQVSELKTRLQELKHLANSPQESE